MTAGYSSFLSLKPAKIVVTSLRVYIPKIVTRRRINQMSLVIGMPLLFFLGLAAMGLCYLFMEACEKI